MVWSLVLLNWISLAENKYFHKQTLLNWDFFLWHFCMQFLIPHSPNWSFFFSPVSTVQEHKKKKNKQTNSVSAQLPVFNRRAKTGKKVKWSEQGQKSKPVAELQLKSSTRFYLWISELEDSNLSDRPPLVSWVSAYLHTCCNLTNK